MAADTSDDDGGFGPVSSEKLTELVTKATIAGKQAALPVLQDILRQEVVRLLSQNDPEVLKQYIDVGYPIVENELPDGYRNALATAGPKFEDQILQVVTPDTVLHWLSNPDEWMTDDIPDETRDDVREVADILKNYPGGYRWLENQVLAVYEICGIV